MPYALTLPLDEVAAVSVQRMWRALAEQAGTDDAVRLSYVPHITLAILPDTAPTEAVGNAVFDVAARWTAFPVVLAGLGIFPGSPVVVWAAPVVTAELLSKHADLHSALARFEVDAHYKPGSWVPHVTLSQEGPASSAQAIEAAGSAWRGPFTAKLGRMDFVRFHPVKVLRSQVLQKRQ